MCHFSIVPSFVLFSGLCTYAVKLDFRTVITVSTVITPYSTVKITVGQNYSARPYKTVPPYSTIWTVIWPFGSNLGPKQLPFFCSNVHEKEKKNYAGSENHSPHEVKEK